jgi:hypothetical protein
VVSPADIGDDDEAEESDRAAPGPLDRVADVFVFAPLGLVLDARHLWPDLANRGRHHLRATKNLGRRAVGRGRTWAGDQLGRAHDQASAAIDGLGLSSNGDRARVPVPRPVGATPRPDRPPRPPGDAEESISVVDVDTLAIPGYDSLSASQVVPRLAGLSPDELEQVRRYEAGNRGRKTILNKIAQLQSG